MKPSSISAMSMLFLLIFLFLYRSAAFFLLALRLKNYPFFSPRAKSGPVHLIYTVYYIDGLFLPLSTTSSKSRGCLAQAQPVFVFASCIYSFAARSFCVSSSSPPFSQAPRPRQSLRQSRSLHRNNFSLVSTMILVPFAFVLVALAPPAR
jgi:hypothetical protein